MQNELHRSTINNPSCVLCVAMDEDRVPIGYGKMRVLRIWSDEGSSWLFYINGMI